MPLRLEPRRAPSAAMGVLAPAIAVLLAMAAGVVLFSLLGYDGPSAIIAIFIEPATNPARWPDLGVKAAPLIIIAVGLSIGFRANVWNIGAEGQYIVGAICGGGVALATWGQDGAWILPAMIAAGVLGGMAYAAIPAALKTRLGVSEILVSLMLSYVAIQILNFLTTGPWKDPAGFNFPQTRIFTDAQTLPYLLNDGLTHLGVAIAPVIALAAWALLRFTRLGFDVTLVGLAPRAAAYAGVRRDRMVWFGLLAGGGCAGLAGVLEAAGPFQQLTPQFPVNYGFTAIIVAFLGRLNPLGVVVAGLVMAVSYVGGEIAQTTLRLPAAATAMFQAMMLFFLLATDVLIRHRLVWRAEGAKA